MKSLLIKLAVFALILGTVGVSAAEPKILGKAVEYS
jgi:hypothetical protein